MQFLNLDPVGVEGFRFREVSCWAQMFGRGWAGLGLTVEMCYLAVALLCQNGMCVLTVCFDKSFPQLK